MEKYENLFLTLLAPPEVILPETNVTKFSGESVKITCATYGDPDPVMKWFKMNGDGERKELSYKGESSAYQRVFYEDGVLTVNEIIKDDEGSYVCEASNTAGKDSKVVKLNVTGE